MDQFIIPELVVAQFFVRVLMSYPQKRHVLFSIMTILQLTHRKNASPTL